PTGGTACFSGRTGAEFYFSELRPSWLSVRFRQHVSQFRRATRSGHRDSLFQDCDCMSTHGEPSHEAAQGAASQRPLASRLARLGATIVDVIIALAIGLPIGFATGYLQRAMEQTASIAEMMVHGAGGLIVFLLLHGYFLATRGQTIGKMAVGVRIVD